jgi:pimeloyl-ACP methyl ester carboxylesterase
MAALCAALFVLTAAAAKPVEVLFAQVAPPAAAGRSAGQDRAVVLIHGLGLHLISTNKVVKPELRAWQQPGSPLVKELARGGDVYGVSYSQTDACDRIGESPALLARLLALKKAGYREIVLVGHSAGGLVAREIAEDHPDVGVTKVVQVCAPNTGSNWASLRTARHVQIAFLTSLTHAARARALQDRRDKRIPRGVEFVCVVGSWRLGGDGVVSCRSQWSADLQAQGVPAYALRTSHWEAMRSARAAELIGVLVREKQNRWDAATVAAVRKKLLGG